MKKKIILFDFDGTLWNTADLVLNRTQKVLKNEISLEEAKGFYTHNADMILKIKDKNHELKSIEELDLITKEHHEEKIKRGPFEGIIGMLDDLKSKDVILGLITLSKRENCLPILEKYDAVKYFKYIHTVEDGISKTVSVEDILEKESLNISEVLFVTDTVGDTREMDVLGVDTIGVLYGMHDINDFNNHKTENLVATANTVEDLSDYIQSKI